MLPEALLDLFRASGGAGGRALVVGGTVRDALLGNPGKDFDIEVHGLDIDRLVHLLRRFGHVNEVGKSFGVLKLRVGPYDLDVSLPRRDSKAGTGHKGIRATADPEMGLVEAARRRDLTINAIAYDPLLDEFVDPFCGREDLDRKVLRAVDPHTFGEDPLRALRVAQFAARFQFAVDPALEALCRTMPLRELPAERIRGEVEKLLQKGARPSAGWALAERAGLWGQVLPEWDHPCPPRLDEVARLPIAEPGRRLALLYAAACDGLDVPATTAVLDRLRVFRVGGYPVRRQVLFCAAHGAEARGSVPLERVRRLADEGELELLALLAPNDDLAQDAAELGVSRAPLPPLLLGKDLEALGVPPGPEMGQLLARVRELQLAGELTSADDARSRVAGWRAAGTRVDRPGP